MTSPRLPHPPRPRRPAVPRTAALGLACTLALLAAFPAASQEGWSGSLGLAVVDQSSDGSAASFRTQTNLRDGLVLDGLSLHWSGSEESRRGFVLEASGFGGAEPSERARLELELDSPWTFALRYDRRRSFFSLQESDLGVRFDRWDITRLRGTVEWQGLKAADLSLDLRSYRRDGTGERTLFAFNELYPIGIQVDESLSEAALRVETKTLPVKLIVEQAFSTYQRANRRSPLASSNESGDPDVLVGAATDRDDEQEVPTTRVIATYANRRFELAASGLYRQSDLDAPSVTSSTFDIGGGAFGTVAIIDDLLAAADLDTVAGDLKLGFQLAPDWRLRLQSRHRDTSTDAAAMGVRLFRITNVFGDVLDLPGLVESQSRFDVTDQDTRLELEWERGDWTVWGGGFVTEREVDYRIDLGEEDRNALQVDRDSDGVVFGLAYHPSRRLDLSAEYEHGSFDRFVFRTEPETVERITLRLRADLGKGWGFHAFGRFEEGDNPAEIAALDRSSDAMNAGVDWSSEDADASFGIDVHLTDLSTDTALVLPDGGGDLSRYDLSLMTVTAHGHLDVGRVELGGDLTRLDDSGETWPLESWTARLRLAVEVAPRLDVTLFGEYWDYEEERSVLDDYEVTRYGVGFRTRFD